MVEQHDVARQVLVDRPQAVRDPRAQARIALAQEAGVHLEQARAVGEAVGVHAADDRQVVDAPGEVRDRGRRLTIPAWPCRANLRDEPSSLPGLRALSSGSLSSVGIGLPSCLVSSGLGSNVSTWLTPPYMNRTMHALALAGKCGALGPVANRGPGPASAAAADRGKKPSAPAGRRAPCRRSRRRLPTETPGASGRKGSAPVPSVCLHHDDSFIVRLHPFSDRVRGRPSIVVNELVHVQNDQTKRFEGRCRGHRSALPGLHLRPNAAQMDHSQIDDPLSSFQLPCHS